MDYRRQKIIIILTILSHTFMNELLEILWLIYPGFFVWDLSGATITVQALVWMFGFCVTRLVSSLSAFVCVGGDQISPVADFLCFPDCCSRAENSPSLSCEEVWLSLSWWNISLWRIKPDFYWANNRIGYACQHLTVQTLENNWSKSRYWSSCMLIQVTPFVFQG